METVMVMMMMRVFNMFVGSEWFLDLVFKRCVSRIMPLLSELFRHRLWPNDRGLLHQAVRDRRRRRQAGYPRHCQAGGVQCHARAVHAVWGGIPLGLLPHGEAVLRGGVQVPQAGAEGEGQGRVPDANRGQQGRHGQTTPGEKITSRLISISFKIHGKILAI